MYACNAKVCALSHLCVRLWRYRLPQGSCRMFSTELFSHRRNKDGTIVSICARCYLTVGTAWNESELPKIEHSHTCNPDWLFRWQLLSR